MKHQLPNRSAHRFSSNLRTRVLPWVAAGVLALGGSQAQAQGGRGGAAPDPAGVALESLRRSSTAPVETRVEDGSMTAVSASVPVADPEGEAIPNALAFLNDYRDLYGLTDPAAELYPHRLSKDADDGDHVFPLDPVTLPHVFDESLTQLPLGFKLDVTVTMNEVSLPMHIVDQTGRVVARSKAAEPGEGIILSFGPDFNYHYVQPDGETRLPWETQYSLEFPPDAGEDPFEVEIVVEAVTP